MEILITGAMGHVGYATACAAERAGDRVIAQYRETYRPDDALALRGATWARCDLGDIRSVERLFENRPIEACIHAAAISNEAYAAPNPLAAVEANVNGTANLLEMVRRKGVRRFIFVSTGSVFQDSDGVAPIEEDARPFARNVYGTTKLCAELLTRLYRTKYELSAAVVRISWVYGPPIVTDSPTRGPIPALLLGALRNIPRHDASGGDFAASFTFIDDVADGLLAACRADRLRHDIYHLGPGRNFTTRDVAAAIRKTMPTAVIETGPGVEPWAAYAPVRGPLAGDRLRQDTGFAVGHALDQGIAAYAAWLRARMSGKR